MEADLFPTMFYSPMKSGRPFTRARRRSRPNGKLNLRYMGCDCKRIYMDCGKLILSAGLLREQKMGKIKTVISRLRCFLILRGHFFMKKADHNGRDLGICCIYCGKKHK